MTKQIDKRIGEYFDHTFNFSFLEVFQDIIERIDNVNDEEDIEDAIDLALTYDAEKWTILQWYCDPINCNWDNAYEELRNDVKNYIERYL